MVYSVLYDEVTNSCNTNKWHHRIIYAYYICTYLLHVSALLSCHFQGDDTKISLKHTAIKQVTIRVRMLCTWPVLSQYDVWKLWCQLPEDDQVITPKLTTAV